MVPATWTTSYNLCSVEQFSIRPNEWSTHPAGTPAYAGCAGHVLIAPKYLGSICKIEPAGRQKLKNTLADYFSKAAKSAAVAVYSSPEKLNDANTKLEEKLVLENIFET